MDNRTRRLIVSQTTFCVCKHERPQCRPIRCDFDRSVWPTTKRHIQSPKQQEVVPKPYISPARAPPPPLGMPDTQTSTIDIPPLVLDDLPSPAAF